MTDPLSHSMALSACTQVPRTITTPPLVLLLGVIPITVIIGSVACLGAEATPRSAAIGELSRVWEARQSRSHSARLHWHETTTNVGEVEFLLMSPAERQRRKGKIPPERTIDREASVSIDGKMLRYAYSGPVWRQESQDYGPGSYVGAFDGDQVRTFSEGDAAKSISPKGIIFSEPKHPDLGNRLLLPLLLMFRPISNDWVRLDLAKCSIRPEEGLVDGRTCMILENPGSGRMKMGYWVDKTDFLIRRVVDQFERKVVYQMEINYKKDSVNGWVPWRWTGMSLDATGAVISHCACQVISYELNPSVPRNEFQVVFPEGTVVADRTRGGVVYVVRPDQSERPISTAEMRAGIPYARLLVTDTDEDTSRKHRGTRLRIGLGGVAVILFLLVYYLFVRRRSVRA